MPVDLRPLARRTKWTFVLALPLLGVAMASCSESETAPSPACEGDPSCAVDTGILDTSSPPDTAMPTDAPDTDGAADADPTDASDSADADAATEAAAEASADAGPFVPLATGLGNIRYVVVAGGYVYFDVWGGSADVWRVPVSGGAVTKFTTPSGSAADLLAVDATNVYVSTAAGEAYKIAHTGATPQLVADKSTLGAPNSLASDGTYLWWTEQTGAVKRTPIAGAPADGGVTIGVVNSPTGVAFSGGSVYISEHGPTNLGQIDELLPDGGRVPLVPGAALYNSPPHQIITDGHRLYWVEGSSFGSSSIESALLDGGALRRYAMSAQSPSIATDGVSLYYMAGGAGDTTIVRGPVDGTAGSTGVGMTTLYPHLGYTSSSSLAVDGSWLYWGDSDNGVIYKAAK